MCVCMCARVGVNLDIVLSVVSFVPSIIHN